jgi:hypothetical protein
VRGVSIIFRVQGKFVLMPETKNKATTMNNDSGRHTIWWYVIAVFVFIADQVTKSAVVAEFYLGQRDIVSSFFNLCAQLWSSV